MESLVGYGSDEDNEIERYPSHRSSGSGAAGGPRPEHRRRDDDTNYDDVNMDLSEESQTESEPELPQAEPAPRCPRDDRQCSDDSRDRDYERRDRPDRPRASPQSRPERDRRSPRRDGRHTRSDRERGRGGVESGSSRRGLLGDRPDERHGDTKVAALMDLKPFGADAPPSCTRSQDARDAVSPRFMDRGERRDKDKERDRDNRERHGRRSEERRSGSRHREHRSRSRGTAFPPPGPHSSSTSMSERRGSPPTGVDYRPSSYKVNKKLEVMEKMGLQIKTPDGSMATAQQLRAAASEAPPAHAHAHAPGAGSGLPTYFNASAVQKRKLLWSNKNKTEAEEAAKWSGTRFAQDSDGKQVSKFMRLMGIKEPAAVKPEPANVAVDPIKKQEELFQAMQAQYEVARATTHTMRGVGLGFQRGQY